MKTITYYSGDEFHEDEYDFQVDAGDLREALHEIFANAYDISVESAKNIAEEFDLYDSLEEMFEEEIKDYFEEEAMEEWKEYEEYTKDPYAYYGVSKSDFI